jgi:hypothetical protein
MSALLDDIINLAIDSKQPLPDILRNCLLLGHELKNERLKQRANQELDGYGDGQDLPEYRMVHGRAKGNFVGPGHMQYNSYFIPPVALEESHRNWATTLPLAQSVSAYSDLIKNATTGSFVFPWPGDLLVYYQQRLMQGGFICHSAWQEIPVNALVEVLDAVRNRTLNMALQIKDELGTSYTDLRRIQPTEAAKIQSIVFNNLGGSANVAFGGSVDASMQGQTVIAVGDRQALDRVLTSAGLSSEDVGSLTSAIEADGSKFGVRVGEWIKDKASKVIAGGMKVGTIE